MLVGTPEGKNRFEKVGVYEMIILKCFFKIGWEAVN
jgi:hypothetical protein